MKTEQSIEFNHLLWGYLESNNYQGLPTFLAQNFCDLNQPNSKQENLTPLQYAIKTRRVELVKILLEKGTDLLKPDRNGNYPFDYACMDFPDEIDDKASPRNKNIKPIEEIIDLIFKKHVQASIPIPYDFLHKHSVSTKPKKSEYDATRIFVQESKEIILKPEWLKLLAASPRHDHIFWLGGVHFSGIFIKKEEPLKEWNSSIAFEYFEKYIEKLFENEKNFEDETILFKFNIIKRLIFRVAEKNEQRSYSSPINNYLQDRNFFSWKTYEKLNCAPLWLNLANQNTLSIDIPNRINFPYDCYLLAIKAVTPSTEPLHVDSNNKPVTVSDLDKSALEAGFIECINYLILNGGISELNKKISELITLFKDKRDFASQKIKTNLLGFLTHISTTPDELYDFIEETAARNNDIWFSLLTQIPEEYPLKPYILCKFLVTHKQIEKVGGPLGLMIYLEKILQLPSDLIEANSVTSEQIKKAKEFSKGELNKFTNNKMPEIPNKAKEILDAVAKTENTEEQVKTTATSGSLPTHLEPRVYPDLNTDDSLEDQKQLWELVKKNDANELMAFFTKKPCININQPNPEEGNLTPLQYVASEGLLASTNVLLINKADVNLGDPSPLHLAVKHRHPEIVDSLLDEEKIDLHIKDKHGCFAIDWSNGYFASDLGILKNNKNINKIRAIRKAILKKHIKADIPITYELNKQSISYENFTHNENFIYELEGIFNASHNYQHFVWLGNLYKVPYEITDVKSTDRYRHLKNAVELLIKKAGKLQCQEPFWSEEFLKNFRPIKSILFIFRNYYGKDTYGSPIDEPLGKVTDIDWNVCQSLNCPPLWIKLAKQTKFLDRIPVNINFPYEYYLRAILACELLPCENTSDKKLAISSADKTALETAIDEYIKYLKTLEKTPKQREETVKLAKALFNKGALLGDSKQTVINFLLTLAEDFKELYYYIASLYIPNKDDLIQMFDKKNFQKYFEKIPKDFPLTPYLETLYSIATKVDEDSGKLAMIPRFGKILQIVPSTPDSNPYLIDEEQIREAKNFAIANLNEYVEDKIAIVAKEARTLLKNSTSPSAPPMDAESIVTPTESKDELPPTFNNSSIKPEPTVNSSASIQNVGNDLNTQLDIISISAVTSPTVITTKPELTSPMPVPLSSTSGTSPKENNLESKPSASFWTHPKSAIEQNKEAQENLRLERENILKRLEELDIKEKILKETEKQYSENLKNFNESSKISPQEFHKQKMKEKFEVLAGDGIEKPDVEFLKNPFTP